jgi:ABC-2 type transport system permease protein
MVIFMLAFGGSSSTTYSLGVVNLDAKAGDTGSWSQEFVANLSASSLLEVVNYPDNASAQADLQQGKLSGVLIIPANFSASCDSLFSSPSSQWVNTTLSVYEDKGDAFATQALGPVIQQALYSTLFGKSAANAPSLPITVTAAGLVSSSTTTDARNAILSGMLIYAVFLNVMTFSSGGVEDRETGVLRRYQMSRATSGDILLGQTFGSFVTSGTQVVLVILTGLAFGLDPAGGLAGIAGGILVACLFSLFASGVGLTIGVVVKTRGAATSVSLTIVMILSFFSGLFIPLSIMPASLQDLAQVFPTYYANEAVASLVARGAPLWAPQVMLDIAIICAFSGVMYFIGWLLFRRKYE